MTHSRESAQNRNERRMYMKKVSNYIRQALLLVDASREYLFH